MGNELGQEQNKGSVFSSVTKKDEELCGMTWKQRMIGFVACSVVGFVLSWILTFVFVFSGMNTASYAIIFALCQVLNIAASCFLSTPKGHLKAMRKKHRIIPSVLYIISIILVVVIATATKIKGLTFLFVIFCTICYYWYTISFIPYGTKILKKCCGMCFDMAKE